MPAPSDENLSTGDDLFDEFSYDDVEDEDIIKAPISIIGFSDDSTAEKAMKSSIIQSGDESMMEDNMERALSQKEAPPPKGYAAAVPFKKAGTDQTVSDVEEGSFHGSPIDYEVSMDESVDEAVDDSDDEDPEMADKDTMRGDVSKDTTNEAFAQRQRGRCCRSYLAVLCALLFALCVIVGLSIRTANRRHRDRAVSTTIDQSVAQDSTGIVDAADLLPITTVAPTGSLPSTESTTPVVSNTTDVADIAEEEEEETAEIELVGGGQLEEGEVAVVEEVEEAVVEEAEEPLETVVVDEAMDTDRDVAVANSTATEEAVVDTENNVVAVGVETTTAEDDAVDDAPIEEVIVEETVVTDIVANETVGVEAEAEAPVTEDELDSESVVIETETPVVTESEVESETTDEAEAETEAPVVVAEEETEVEAPTAPSAPVAPTVPTAPTAPVAPTAPTAPTAPVAPTAPAAAPVASQPTASCFDDIEVAKICYNVNEVITMGVTQCGAESSDWVGIYSHNFRGPTLGENYLAWEYTCEGEDCGEGSTYSNTVSFEGALGVGYYRAFIVKASSSPFTATASSIAFEVADEC